MKHKIKTSLALIALLIISSGFPVSAVETYDSESNKTNETVT